MDINGRCGFCLKLAMRAEGGMKDVTPGKWVLKNSGMVSGLDSRVEKCEEGRKSVQVKEPSREGMAMNMNDWPGQMCRW